MNGIVIDTDRVIFQAGPFALRWYSLFFALAILAGGWLGLREARRKGLDAEKMQALILWGVLGGLAGARLFHVVNRWDLYADDPIRVLYVWEGGLAVYGGLIGGTLVGSVYAWRTGLPLWRTADAAAPGLILGQAVGRIACIPNGDAYGAPTDAPWAFIYTNPAAMMVPTERLGVPVHPYPLYELLFGLALFGLLWGLRDSFGSDGLLFLTYAGVYAAGRFLLTFFRTEQVWFFGLQEAQVVALVVLVVLLPLLFWRLRAGSSPGRKPA
ncbi:MAG: prolipoprotein diacylglyceryl transferase [Actinomycetota bacterium]|nr:prolipoprotein diacylglyceryl transferase [Actinomycetota bacterium]